MYFEQQQLKDLLGRVATAGEYRIALRPWDSGDGTVSRKVRIGDLDPTEAILGCKALERRGLVRYGGKVDGDDRFLLTDLGKAVALGESPWPEAHGDAAAAETHGLGWDRLKADLS